MQEKFPKMSDEFRSDMLIHNGHLVVVQERLVKVFGLDRAVFIQKLHYWLNTESGVIIDRRRWVYNTLEQWHNQSPWWSARTIRRIISDLEELKVIVSAKINVELGDHTKWYTIDYGVMNQLEKNYIDAHSKYR